MRIAVLCKEGGSKTPMYGRYSRANAMYVWGENKTAKMSKYIRHVIWDATER
jgi:hypothetical protein